jgi:hypothetical protein
VSRCLALAALLALYASAGCSRSEEALQADMDAYVAERNGCAADDECTIAGGGCPLGCGFAVHVDAVDEINAHSAELIAEYERVGRSCEYCCLPLVASCADGTCEASEAPIDG